MRWMVGPYLALGQRGIEAYVIVRQIHKARHNGRLNNVAWPFCEIISIRFCPDKRALSLSLSLFLLTSSQ